MLKLNVGLNRKIGEANYGSRGASVHLELEFDGGLVHDPDRLHDRIRQLFHLARASLDEELRRNGQQDPRSDSRPESPRLAGNGRPATQSQVRAIRAIAARQKINLAAELRRRFQVERPQDLDLSQASELIDAIKPESSNGGGR
ncbi:MAG: hypothetical protein ABIK89_17115 [Planctomycetota bacterium]